MSELVGDAVVLCLEAIDGGSALALVNKAVSEISDDILERPGVLKARVVEVKISIKPKVNKDTMKVEKTEIDVSVGKKVPGWGVFDVGSIHEQEIVVDGPIQERLFGDSESPGNVTRIQ